MTRKVLIPVGIIGLVLGLIIWISNSKSSQAKPPQAPEIQMQATPNSAFKTTPLHTAAEQGELQDCQALVAEGADVNALDELGWSPLILAVQNDQIEVARFLLQSGAGILYQYRREDTPEERAKRTKEQQRVEQQWDFTTAMKETFKDLPKDLREEMTSEDALKEMSQEMIDLYFEPSNQHAIEYCHSLDMLKLLVTEFKADPNHVSDDGYWPLSSFAESNDLDAVKWLLENGTDPNNTSTGETAIFKAIHNDDHEMVKLFIHHGAKLDVEDVDGWSVLFAVGSLKMAKHLISLGADPTSLDQAGFPCWHWVGDTAAKAYLKEQATKRGLKRWTELPNK